MYTHKVSKLTRDEERSKSVLKRWAITAFSEVMHVVERERERERERQTETETETETETVTDTVIFYHLRETQVNGRPIICHAQVKN